MLAQTGGADGVDFLLELVGVGLVRRRLNTDDTPACRQARMTLITGIASEVSSRDKIRVDPSNPFHPCI